MSDQDFRTRVDSPGLELVDAELVDVATLSTGLSPRLGPVRPAHVDALMEVIDVLPPVLVQRRTMTVIDGAHRLEAHRKLGRSQIPARLIDGPDAEIFVLAVRANTTHGLPLSLAERRRSARVILTSGSPLSDRAIATICGLSHTTVGKLRMDGLAPGAMPGPSRRLGRDGRRRAWHPRPEDGADTERAQILDLAMFDDPALHCVPELAEFVGWLERTSIAHDDWSAVIDAVPLGRCYLLADEARRRARSWSDLAEAIEARARRRTS